MLHEGGHLVLSRSSRRGLSECPVPLLISLSIKDLAPEECHLCVIHICDRALWELSKHVFISPLTVSIEKIEHFNELSCPSPTPMPEAKKDFRSYWKGEDFLTVANWADIQICDRPCIDAQCVKFWHFLSLTLSLENNNSIFLICTFSHWNLFSSLPPCHIVCERPIWFLSRGLLSTTRGQSVMGVGRPLEHVLSQMSSQLHLAPTAFVDGPQCSAKLTFSMFSVLVFPWYRTLKMRNFGHLAPSSVRIKNYSC